MFTWPQGFETRFFDVREFDHPELMDPNFIKDLDLLRERCGFGIKILDDARTESDLRRLYKREIELGLPWPKDSAHLFIHNQLVRAVDFRPLYPTIGDGCDLPYEGRELILVSEIIRMYKDRTWINLGLIVETKHIHVDDCPRIASRRPLLSTGESR